MNIWKPLFISLLLIGIVGNTCMVQAVEDKQNRPSGTLVAIDAIPVRIAGLAVTVVGGAVFVVSLPFTVFTDVGTAWDALVVDPFLFTFVRPLGQFYEWRSRLEENGATDEPEGSTRAQME
ncbi:MAG: multidrug transporter [SAR324 cluster bacterium]|nr:multidrug transporter [SAR324 cluster bacterium]